MARITSVTTQIHIAWESFFKVSEKAAETCRKVLLLKLGVNSCQMVKGFLKQNPIWI